MSQNAFAFASSAGYVLRAVVFASLTFKIKFFCIFRECVKQKQTATVFDVRQF